MKPINPPTNIPEDMYTEMISFILSDFVWMRLLCIEVLEKYFGSACIQKNQTRSYRHLIDTIMYTDEYTYQSEKHRHPKNIHVPY